MVRKEGYCLTEKVIIVGCQTDDDDIRFSYSLEELCSLTATAKGEIVATVTQKRDRIDPATYLGKGKQAELAVLADELAADLIIYNDELSPSQIRNVTTELEAKVIDRTQLILDIFAMRARSKEGKLQVELAQLQYLLPRLRGQGVQLSRLGAGIGTRGPGETKLETDRRHILRRIDELKIQLSLIVQHRQRYRERRKRNKVLQIALVGYTNAGKSTIFNRLTVADSLEENQLFATLDPMTKKFLLPSGFRVLLTDTVGFIQDLPTTLIAAFRSTLEEVTEADLLLHVVDSANPDYFQHEDTVNAILKELEMDQIPVLTVYNKSDIQHERFVPASKHRSIQINAYQKQDQTRLKIEVEKMLMMLMSPYNVKIPADEGALLSQLRSRTILQQQSFLENEQSYLCSGYYHPDQQIAGKLQQFEYS
ncbi:GTPase HflX [Bacillaceae bacterium Marseille-Q3522]|nr:GTPase HflX [Bacillaceae bacterium Marseille-Q3522]